MVGIDSACSNLIHAYYRYQYSSVVKVIYYYISKEVCLHFCNNPMSRSKIRNKVILKSNQISMLVIVVNL